MLSIKNASLFINHLMGKEDPGSYFYLNSGPVIKTSGQRDFFELEDILIFKRFGPARSLDLIMDLVPGNGAFSLILGSKAAKTLLVSSQKANPAFEENLTNNQNRISNIERLSVNRAQIPADVSVLEHIFSIKSIQLCPLLHLQCYSYDEYDLIYKAPTKMIPQIKEFCISYQDIDTDRGYDMENLVRYIATAANYKMNKLHVRGDGSGTIWLSQK